MNENDVIRAWTLSNSLNFTRYFFKKQYKKKFIVGDHHRIICHKLDEVLQGKCRRLIINIAPRYSKTELAVKNFIAMGLAINPAAKFIHLSYSADLAMDNSITIKDIVNTEEYQELYSTRIKYGSDTKCRWDTTEGGGVYAVSTLGQITGFGAGAVDEPGKPYKFSGAIVIDDPIKPEDALSDNVRNTVNRRFETTIRNRVNSRNTPIIIIMQRLHEDDLCGYLMKSEERTGEHWDVVSLPCLMVDEETGEETSLWPFKHSVAELRQIQAANSFVFETQYMQNPKPLQGLMYTRFRTYSELPIERHLGVHKNYTDTADTGADYLCSIDYVEFESGCYVTDILFTKKPMEDTEPATARMLDRDKTQIALIESNNGGRGFARNVEKQLRYMGNRSIQIKTFTQTENKAARIFNHSNEVQNLVFFPEGWDVRWPDYYQAMTSYRKEGGNTHDDAPDATTGIVENFQIGVETELTAEEEEAIEDEMY